MNSWLFFGYCVNACFVLMYCAPINKCDAEAGFSFVINCMFCFNLWIVHVGVQGDILLPESFTSAEEKAADATRNMTRRA